MINGSQDSPFHSFHFQSFVQRQWCVVEDNLSYPVPWFHEGMMYRITKGPMPGETRSNGLHSTRRTLSGNRLPGVVFCQSALFLFTTRQDKLHLTKLCSRLQGQCFRVYVASLHWLFDRIISNNDQLHVTKINSTDAGSTSEIKDSAVLTCNNSVLSQKPSTTWYDFMHQILIKTRMTEIRRDQLGFVA